MAPAGSKRTKKTPGLLTRRELEDLVQEAMEFRDAFRRRYSSYDYSSFDARAGKATDQKARHQADSLSVEGSAEGTEASLSAAGMQADSGRSSAADEEVPQASAYASEQQSDRQTGAPEDSTAQASLTAETRTLAVSDEPAMPAHWNRTSAWQLWPGATFNLDPSHAEEDLAFIESLKQKHTRNHHRGAILRCMYHRINASKLVLVDHWLLEYTGHEDTLLTKVAKRYNVSIPTKADCVATNQFDDGSKTWPIATLEWRTGDVYEGTWKVIVPKGDRASGRSHKGPRGVRKMHGQGVFHYVATGDSYRGGFMNGMRHGYGEYFWKEGPMVYFGEWHSDRRQGQGLFYDKDGSRSIGTYHQDKKECSVPLTKVGAMQEENKGTAASYA